ncbi:MAG: sulfotransferase domain-containing protein, partial [Actinomycetota bacterium]|nr:sulfotransferase domain-containing protein [Actinomycetota bacterium]
VTDINDYRALFRGVSGEVAIGEASHWYLYHPKAPRRIKHHIPDVKLVAILRNPVDRAYSQFLHFVRDGQEPLADFAQALREEDRRIHDHWAFGRYASRGFYYSQLKRYYDLFDRSQIKVHLYEDLSADAPTLLRDTFRFLEVDPTFVPELSVEPNVSGIPRNRVLHAMLTRSGRTKAVLRQHLPTGMLELANRLKNRNLVKPQLSPELRLEMTEMYREEIVKLEDLIGRDLSGWLGRREA